MRRLLWEVYDYSYAHKGHEHVERVSRFRKFSEAIAYLIRFGEYDLQIRRYRRKHEALPRKRTQPVSVNSDCPF